MHMCSLTECRVVLRLIATSFPEDYYSSSNAEKYFAVEYDFVVALITIHGAYSVDYDCVAG